MSRTFSAIAVSASLLLACLASRCDFSSPTNTPPTQETFTFDARNLFPFQNTSNWWRYTETTSNPLSISVIDTITDNSITYYKVSFKENRRDTTDDWFRSSTNGVQYNDSLVGTYETFLPAVLTGRNGTFSSGGKVVSYSYKDSATISSRLFRRVVSCRYSAKMLHGFNEIDFADSIGIVSLVDTTGRFPVVYALDSALIDGALRKF